MSYFVYILESNLNRRYVELTSELQERIKKYNFRHKGFSGTTGIWRIIIYKEVATKSEAIQLEKNSNHLKIIEERLHI